jgi:hypothetical protein
MPTRGAARTNASLSRDRLRQDACSNVSSPSRDDLALGDGKFGNIGAAPAWPWNQQVT